MGPKKIFKMKKILILVMSHETEDDVFKTYKKAWDETIKITKDKFPIDVLFLYSDNSIGVDYVIKENKLYVNCVENYWDSLLIKVISGFKFFMENNYDLVFKTNLSTIVNFDKFYEYCSTVNHNNIIYEGVIGLHENYKFCSGAGMLLNKKTVSMVLDKQDMINSSWTDDIFIGYVLNVLNNIQPTNKVLNRFDVVDNMVLTNEIKNYTHIRIKIRKNNKDIYYTNKVLEMLYL